MKFTYLINIAFKNFILNLLILLSACPFMGQAQQKKQLTENDYSQWGNLNIKNISNKGNWVSCEMNYENQNDTLLLINTSKTKIFSFAKGKNGQFGTEKFFAFLEPESKLKVIELLTGKVSVYPNVEKYELACNGKYIITFNNVHGQKKLMTIRNSQCKILESIVGVTEYSLSQKGDAIMFTTMNQNSNEVAIINFKNYSHLIITKDQVSRFSKLVWQDEGTSVVFFKETDPLSKSAVLHFFNIANKKLYTLDFLTADRSENLIINQRFPISISKDGEKVFFMEIEKFDSNFKKNSQSVEVWNGNDKWLYADRIRAESKGGSPKLAVWFPYSNLYTQISTSQEPSALLTGLEQYAIIYNKNTYGLQSKYHEEVDFYLRNIKTNSKKLFLEKQSCDPSQMGFEKSNNKIFYYRDKNWFVYDPVLSTHTMLTKKILTTWDNSAGSSVQHEFMAYGIAGWSMDSKFVLLYDAFDIWQVATDGSSFKRLTQGREKDIVFRIAEVEKNGEKLKTFDLSKEYLLKATNIENWSTGYYNLSVKSGEEPLVYESSEIDQIFKSENNVYAYRSQAFSDPPRIEVKKKDNNPKILFISNKQQKEYYFGKSELLYYSSNKGDKLKSALFYPANFLPGKKYPMIVYIYDTMSKNLNKYVNPSMQNSDGFNITNYTLNDYFVLLPDIKYELGNPGISAVNCVTSAVKRVLEEGFINKDKIGLFGHSFGGYQTNFILTQSTIFSAAVSGAGVSDITGFYFNISKNGIFQSDMWRFESQQWRIGKSLYQNKEAYFRNSPIIHAENIKTPLLLWAGKDDRVIPWNQSASYYLALRKLGIKNIMLIYPNEDHTITNPLNQKDLTTKMMTWFNYFLKDQNDSEWIISGTSTY